MQRTDERVAIEREAQPNDSAGAHSSCYTFGNDTRAVCDHGDITERSFHRCAEFLPVGSIGYIADQERCASAGTLYDRADQNSVIDDHGLEIKEPEELRHFSRTFRVAVVNDSALYGRHP